MCCASPARASYEDDWEGHTRLSDLITSVSHEELADMVIKTFQAMQWSIPDKHAYQNARPDDRKRDRGHVTDYQIMANELMAAANKIGGRRRSAPLLYQNVHAELC